MADVRTDHMGVAQENTRVAPCAAGSQARRLAGVADHLDKPRYPRHMHVDTFIRRFGELNQIDSGLEYSVSTRFARGGQQDARVRFLARFGF